jgi:hypothetical protein
MNRALWLAMRPIQTCDDCRIGSTCPILPAKSIYLSYPTLSCLPNRGHTVSYKWSSAVAGGRGSMVVSLWGPPGQEWLWEAVATGANGNTWSYLACKIGHLVPVLQPLTGSSFQ